MTDEHQPTSDGAVATRLEYGRHIPHWPHMKLLRAKGQFHELLNRWDMWMSAQHVYAVPTFSADRLSAELHLVVEMEPPVEEWSLILGDVVHNLVSSLDSLAWAICTLDGATPASPNRVYFPADEKESSWKGRVKDLDTMTPEILERIRAIQPWTLPEPRRSVLHIIKALNNEDKHRQLVTLESSVRSVASPKLTDGTWTDFSITPSNDDQSLTNGKHLGTIVAAQPFPDDPHFDRLQIAARMKVVVSELTWELSSLLQQAVELVRDCTSWVQTGEIRPPLLLNVELANMAGDPTRVITQNYYIDDEDRARAV